MANVSIKLVFPHKQKINSSLDKDRPAFLFGTSPRGNLEMLQTDQHQMVADILQNTKLRFQVFQNEN